MNDTTYTYRAGVRLPLVKAADQFVVRALPDRVGTAGVRALEQVSPHSTRVTVDPAQRDAAMADSRAEAVTHHAYSSADSGAEFLITDRVFVRFRNPPTAAELDAFAGRYGLLRLATYGERDFLFQLTDHTGMNPVKLVVALTENDPAVESADHDLNQRAKRYQLALPTDPSYQRQWHLHQHLLDPQFDPRASSRCEQAWELLGHYGSPDIVVGITDDGCKLDHGDFAGADKFAGWGYFAGSRLVVRDDPDADPQRMYESGSNHGTACAGVIAAAVNGRFVVGAAPGCRLLPVKWEAQGPALLISDSKLLAALDYLAPRVDIVSNSWGGVPTSLWSPQVVSRIGELARSGGRRGSGILFLWAAGNENCPIQHQADQSVPYDDGWQVRTDGSWAWVGVSRTRSFRNNLVGINGLMHVAALASTAERSHYSNYGTGILIAAPSNNVHEYQRLSVRGLGITTTTGASTGITASFGGTSSATPLVAGIAALTLSANPALSGFELGAVLRRTAAKDVDFERYPRTPPASYDPDTSWDVSPVAPWAQGEFRDTGDADGSWSPWYGHGRIDAANAVAEALRRRGGGTGGGTGGGGGGDGGAGGTTLQLRRTSSPARVIPDNDPAGIGDRIAVGESGRLAGVRVEVDISHTWIGDLRVSLVAPGGDEVVLHARGGGRDDDIRRAYDITTTPALAALLGKPVQGDWTLRVADLARSDVGRLNAWVLALEVQVPQPAQPSEVVLEDAPGLGIPDATAAGIERVLRVAAPGRVQAVTVDVDITHSWIGDLSVDLIAPSGRTAPLHQRAGGSADNLIVRYADTAALRALVGEAAQGDWRLRVVDHAAEDVGKLNRWALRVRIGA